MSHIILDVDFEVVLSSLKDNAYVEMRSILLPVIDDDFVFPVVVAPSDEGVIVRVDNGGNHIDKIKVQSVLARVARRIVLSCGASVVRSTLSKRVLRAYGLSYA